MKAVQFILNDFHMALFSAEPRFSQNEKMVSRQELATTINKLTEIPIKKREAVLAALLEKRGADADISLQQTHETLKSLVANRIILKGEREKIFTLVQTLFV